MKIKMKELPISERPYEKLKTYGAEKLTNSELLAILIKNGTKDYTAIDLANNPPPNIYHTSKTNIIINKAMLIFIRFLFIVLPLNLKLLIYQ